MGLLPTTVPPPTKREVQKRPRREYYSRPNRTFGHVDYRHTNHVTVIRTENQPLISSIGVLSFGCAKLHYMLVALLFLRPRRLP